MKNILLFIVFSITTVSFEVMAAAEEVALLPGEIKSTKDKSDRLTRRNLELAEYVKQSDYFLKNSINEDRLPVYLNYNGSYGIHVTVYGVISRKGMVDIFRKCWELFDQTNVKYLKVDFYKKEVKIVKGKSWRYVPTDLLFSITSQWGQ